MIFFHTYESDYWAGLEKHGFLSKNTGIKLTQCAGMPAGDMFNIIASPNSKLHKIIQDLHCPFYMDRIQGGSYYYSYPYDKDLLKVYDELLGDDFYGFQMHEWASNYKGDWERIQQNIGSDEYTAENIFKAIDRVSLDKKNIHLETGTPLEFSRKIYPNNMDEFLSQLDNHYKERMSEIEYRLMPCDSYYMATRIEFAHQSKRIMPEVGAQIPHMRIQMAHARGMCGSYQKDFGSFYEPWGGKPFSVVVSRRDSTQNEWRIRQEDFPFSFTENIGMGGSSRMLQRRIYYYSLLCGAKFIAEEWGAINTFEEWTEFTLSEYGKIKKEFLHDLEQLPEMGTPFIPIALVLPKEYPMIDLNCIKAGQIDKYLGYPINGVLKENIQLISNALFEIFGRKDSTGNEGHVIENSGYGDYFDIVYEDTPNLQRYSCLVDLSVDKRLAHTNYASTHRIISGKDVLKMRSLLKEYIQEISPVSTDSLIHYTLNNRGKEWTLGLFNNEGIDRSVEYGDKQNPAAEISAVFKFKEPCVPKLMKSAPEQCKVEKISDTEYRFIVSPGSIAILTF